METRTYNGYTYQRVNAGEPWVLTGSAAQTSPMTVVTKRADPYAAEDQQIQRRSADRQDASAQLAAASAARAAANDAQSDARNNRSDRIDNPQKLRREYGSLPEIKSFRVSTQMADAALRTAANPQGDIALTYSFAKAMDPDSVVRDQEQGSVTNSQPWFQSAVESVKKQFGMDGAGSFTPQARAALRQEIIRSVSSRKPLYDARRAEMADYAKANGIDPYQVVGRSDVDVYADGFRSYAKKYGDQDNVIASFIGGEPIQQDAKTLPAPQAAGYGATTAATLIPSAMQQEQHAYLAANWGKIDPADYTAFRVNLDRKYGFGSNASAYTADVPKLNAFAARGGTPQQTGIQDIKRDLSALDQFRNNALSDRAGVGAGVAAGLNAAGLGIPSLLAPEEIRALRDANPVTTTIGDIGGGVVGTGLVGKGFSAIAGKASPTVAALLTNPLTADVAYGAGYGATQAEDPFYGAVGGGIAALLGNRAGRAIGRALPGLTGQGRAISQLDATVPTSQGLKDTASDLYRQAESRGLTASADDTLALADTTSGILSSEGRLSPTGRLTEVQPKTKEMYNLVQDYAGQPMTPTQVQTVRRVASDGLSSDNADERRVARALLNNFDNWTDATNPELAAGLKDARQVASRYLQGDKIAQTRELADVRAGQFANAGQGNALRTDFRQLDRSIARGNELLSPDVAEAVTEVARGTPVGNGFRNIGRFAPTGPMSVIPMLLAAGGGGAAVGPAGAAGGLTLGALAFGARQVGQAITNRSAQVAENIAYGGPAYKTQLEALLEEAATRGGHGGASIGSEVARALTQKLRY